MERAKKILAGILASIIAFSSEGVLMASNAIVIKPKLEDTVEVISVKDTDCNKSSENGIKHKYGEIDKKNLNKRTDTDVMMVTSASNVENISEITPKVNDLVLEDKNYIYTLNNENATITGYTGDGGDISIPESLDGHTVVSIAQNAFSGCSSITGIILPKSITYIGASFASGTQITSITIPKSVMNVGVTTHGNFGKAYGPLTGAMQLKEVIFEEGMTTIPAYMCRTTYNDDWSKDTINNIETIYIPDSIENIGDYAFYNCKSITQIVMPKSIEVVGNHSFYECSNIADLEFIYNSEQKVQIGTYAFAKCEKLERIKLTNNIASIVNGAFAECSSIADIILPENLTYLGASFASGTKITSITIPKCVTNVGVTTHGDFGKAYGPLTGALQLKEVIFEDGITTIPAYMCRTIYSDDWSSSTINQIEKVYLPESVNSIGNFAFYGCTNIKEIELPKHLTSVGYYAFTNTGITRITIPKDLKKCESGNGGWRSGPFAGAINLKEVIFEEGIETIPANIFASETRQIYISQIVIPDGVKKIESEAFYCCNDLSAILIPESVTEIDYDSFYKCDKLIIYGYENSYAKTYADENNIPFKNVSEFDFGNNNDDDDNQQTVVDDSYGVNSYKKTSQEKVYDDAKNFYNYLNQYIEAFKSSAQSDTKSKGGDRTTIAKKLREADAKTNDKIITPDMTATEESLKCVYETLADYLETYTQTGIEIGKINLKQDYITISAGIVNKIRNSIGSEEFTRTFKNYTVTFYVGNYFGSNFGSVKVTGKRPWIANGIIKSSAKDTAKILTDYVNDLSDVAKDLLKQALTSVVIEFADKTAISEFTKKQLESIFKGKVDSLCKNGYGEILKNMIKLRDSYDVIKDIINASKKGDDYRRHSKMQRKYTTKYRNLIIQTAQ